MGVDAVLRRVLQRDHALVVGCLLAVVAASWGWLFAGAGMPMEEMGGMLMAMSPAAWTPGYAALVVGMWAVMMAAMMLPSGAPMILLFATLAQRSRARGQSAGNWGLFAGGYLAIWSVFSLAAAALQFGLEEAALISSMMQTTSTALAGSALVATGLYQWTPFKQACLRRCRSPLDFIVTHWRSGARGAFAMGVRHGAYCVGCCWMLMLLLFVGGVMNMAWIAGLALFVLVEKLAPAGHWIGRVAGLLLIVWGALTLYGAA